MPGKIITLNYVTEQGLRQWRSVRLSIDQQAGKVIFIRPPLFKQTPLDIEANRISDYQIVMWPNARSRIFEAAVAVPLAFLGILLLKYLALGDTTTEAFGIILVWMASWVIGLLVSRLFKVPMIQFHYTLATPAEVAEQQPGSMIAMMHRTLKKQLHRELLKQGRDLSDAELDALIEHGDETLTGYAQYMLDRNKRRLATLAPDLFRVIGRGWYSTLETRELARRFEQVMAAHQDSGEVVAHSQTIDWETIQKRVRFSWWVASLVLVASGFAFVWHFW